MNFAQLSGARLIAAVLLLATSLVSGFAQSSQGPGTAAPSQPAARAGRSSRLTLMIEEWTRARDWTRQYIDKMPEGNFAFKPVPEVRSFAEQMLHLAYWNFGFTARCFGRTTPYKEADLMNGNFQSKAALSKLVTESYDFVISGLKELPEDKLDENITLGDGRITRRIVRINDAYEHQTHHRGQTVIYLRLKGIEPPIEPF